MKDLMLNKNRQKYWKDIPDSLWQDYKWQLKNSINSLDRLSDFYPGIDLNRITDTAQVYPFLITPYFMSLINFDSENDPVAAQVIPSPKELIRDDRLLTDPFCEQNLSPVPGLIKRFPDRAVIVTTDRCASLCRYCTRKWNWSKKISLSSSRLASIVNYLQNHKNIREIIISGGDPFLLNPAFLEEIIGRLLNIPSIDTLRIGTRMLSFLPYIFTDKITAILSRYKPIWLMTHFNHPAEITGDTEKAVDALVNAGVVLCNQTVLLNGVNNNPDTMKKLVHKLQKIRIHPYYMFQCDLVEGTAHFRTGIDEGLNIIKKLQGFTGGLCVPSYVIDLPGGGKIPLIPDYIEEKTGRYLKIKNYEGKYFRYPL